MLDIGKKVIDQDVLAVLKQGTWVADGQGFQMPQMDRKLYDKTSKVLEACGGKWNRKAKATLFEDMEDVQSLLEAAETGIYVDLKKAYQQFDTPDAIANLMLDELQLQGQELLTFLEPSAGNGQLIRAVVRRVNGKKGGGDLQAAKLTAVELDLKRYDRLCDFDVPGSICRTILLGDFLQMLPEQIGSFDRVIMNPPFARSQDIDHVRHAFQCLKPGGILVAIMSPGWTFRSDNKAKLFREKVERCGSYSTIPAGAFSTSGTNIRTLLVTLRKR